MIRISRIAWGKVLKAAFLTAFAAGIAGCATPPVSAMAVVRTIEAPRRARITEYALVELSADSPNHAGFEERVRSAVEDSRSGWWFLRPADAASVQNKALEPFGFRLEPNLIPPFSGYALFRGDTLVQGNIARIWPVTISDGGFQMTLETLEGKQMVASLDGVRALPGQQARADARSLNDEMSSPMAYTGSGQAGLYTSTPDQTDLESLARQDGAIAAQMLAGQPLLFREEHGFVRLYYAGRGLSYQYDLVVHDQSGEAAIFNPGVDGNIAWFYALRDGLWYYVEARAE